MLNLSVQYQPNLWTESRLPTVGYANDAQIHFGKPCVAGTRITVQGILELVETGISFPEIIQDYYPDLVIEDIHACLQYAIALVAAEDICLV